MKGIQGGEEERLRTAKDEDKKKGIQGGKQRRQGEKKRSKNRE